MNQPEQGSTNPFFGGELDFEAQKENIFVAIFSNLAAKTDHSCRLTLAGGRESLANYCHYWGGLVVSNYKSLAK